MNVKKVKKQEECVEKEEFSIHTQTRCTVSHETVTNDSEATSPSK